MQRQYAYDMLKKVGMTACKPLDTPLDANVKLFDDGDYLEVLGNQVFNVLAHFG